MSKPIVTKTAPDISQVIADANYYEVPEGFDVFSWCPDPPGTPNAKPTQVHLHFGVPPSPVMVVRFKGPDGLDALIEALIDHRTDVFGRKAT